MQRMINNTMISVIKGDITEAETEAIVNAANNMLWMGGGVAGAIKRKGGKEIENEAVSKGPIPVGEAVVTGAGRLKAKYVIHAAGMGQDLRTDADKIASCTRASLKRADELGIQSISFPAIGTGVGGFPVDKAAEIMIRTVVEHIKEGTDIKFIQFVLFDHQSEIVFEKILAEIGR